MMVVDGVSLWQIKNYLSRWGYWWVKTAVIWNYDDIACQYIESCWDAYAAKIGAFAFQQNIIESHSVAHHGTAIELAAAA